MVEIISDTNKTEKNCLRLFSALSAFMHAAALTILLIWTGEHLRMPPPVQVITVDLSHLEIPVAKNDYSRAISEPVRLPLPEPVRRITTAPLSSTAEPQPAKPVTTASTTGTVPVTELTPASPGVSTEMPVRPSPAATSARSTPTAPVAANPVTQARRKPDKKYIGNAYMQLCRNLIERHKEYPVLARKGRIEGTVVIKSTLARDGSLQKCGITRSSGSCLLDNAALRAVRTVEHFPPVPPELQGDDLVFELPVSFQLSAE